jgi:hypothetical protein
MPRADASLREWPDLAGACDWQGLLIGNGASRAVWKGFSYPTLFEVANKPELANGLSAADRRLFEALDIESNFEAVLDALLTTRVVCNALRIEADAVEEHYVSIRDALVAAVHHVHVPWTALGDDLLRAIRVELLTHEFVFSTNYDLLIYWAIMAGDPDGFKDFFWDTQFDIGNAEVWGNVTKVLYLHGALHLYRDLETGGTFKERSGDFSNLLARFGRRPNTVPLCITEGTSAEKLAAIGRSDYLSFGLQQFNRLTGPLVIIGQGLGDSDAHLAAILARHRDRAIAIGVYPSNDRAIVQAKAHYRGLLPEANIAYFDSRSHPLGEPSLRIEP